ncbi:MAG TPA: SBBP repeat-containing protein [Candidatus Sulfotelmatobacter sp.]|nr:SBBP repeat-containing protein [Candidatus Sulfotelmatobacter sp.]
MVRGRVLAAGLALLGAGCAVLGWSSRPQRGIPAAAPVIARQFATAAASEPETAVQAAKDAQVRANSLFAGLPLRFEPNQGQGNLDSTDPRARFVARGSGYSLFLGTQGAILSLVSRGQHTSSKNEGARSSARVDSIEMKLAGANPAASMIATDPLRGKSNYFLGNDPAKWRTNVPQFSRVRYENIYPGINLVFYGNQGRLEYDFQVAPGADPSQAELEFHGAKNLELSDGALVIHTQDGSVQLNAPLLYQEIEGRREPVEGKFVLRGANRAGFAVASYDRSRELIIDPILSFSTYFGGSGDEHATSVAVDGSFNIYLTGSTTSPNLPALGTFQTSLSGIGPNVYVAQIIPPLGSVQAQLAYVTYLGGTGSDTPVGIKVDGRGDPFVAGTTTSTDFPTTATNAYQSVPESGSVGTSHVFVTELHFNGTSLLYSSYLSGNNTDVASGMTIDASGNLYVTGTTQSSDAASTTDQFPASTLPQALPYQIAPRAPIQFFVTKVNTNAPRTGSISYSTYFGGGSFETTSPVAAGGGITVDTNGNIYFTGTTNFTYSGSSPTTDFPILNAYQPCLDQAPPTTIVNPPTCSSTTSTTASDAFVAKLNPNAAQGQQLIWSTYLGGTGDDLGTGVAIDPGAVNVYVVGTTNSQDFVSSSLVTTFASYQKCLNNLPVTTTVAITCTTQTSPLNDAFVAKLTNPTTSNITTPVNVALSYFSYLGGSNDEAGLAITVDSGSGALVTGWTKSPNTGTDGTFPVSPNPNSIQTNLTGSEDAFVARLNTVAVVGQTTSASWANYFGGSVTSSAGAGTTLGTGLALDVNQNTYLAGETNTTDLQVVKPLSGGYGGGYDAFVSQLGTAVSLSIQGVLSLGTNQGYISAGNQATFIYTLTNNGPDLASGITVTDDLSSAATIVPVTFNSASISSGNCTNSSSTGGGVSCGPISLQSGSTATITIVVTPTASSSSGSEGGSFNGGTVQVMGPGNIVYARTSVPALMSDYKMSVGPNSQSIAAAGDTAFYTVQLTPVPIYQSDITLSCSNLPAGASCNFSNSPAKLVSTSGVTSLLSLTTTPRPIVTPAASLVGRQFYAIWLAIPGLAFLGIGRRSGRRRRIAIGMLGMVFALLLFIPACSHTSTQAPPSGTPAGSFTITVTATSGSDVKSQPISLTVP